MASFSNNTTQKIDSAFGARGTTGQTFVVAANKFLDGVISATGAATHAGQTYTFTMSITLAGVNVMNYTFNFAGGSQSAATSGLCAPIKLGPGTYTVNITGGNWAVNGLLLANTP